MNALIVCSEWQRDARREGKVGWPPSTNTTYDAPSITMPLIEFLHHPVAHELVHNGATFQVSLSSTPTCITYDYLRGCLCKTVVVIFYLVLRPLGSLVPCFLCFLYHEGVGVKTEGSLFLDFLKYFGSTEQVTGLTNNSYGGNAKVIRKCINLYPKLGYQVLDVAKVWLKTLQYPTNHI